jgi:hypothetical protein
MAYPIKNTITIQSNSLMRENFAIGVNQGGYGLTSSTAFWNGKTPNVGGYVTYVGNGTSSPTMYISTGDTQLIALSNQLGGMGNITTIGDALNLLNFGNYKCLNVEPPNIVTNGIKLYLDAGFTPSYSKSGTFWYDLSGSGNTGTLINGPVYSSDAGGSISFDGTNDYMSVPSLSGTSFPQNTGTISFWYYVDSTGGVSQTIFDVNTSGRSHYSISYDNINGITLSAYNGGTTLYNFSIGGSPNVWNHIVLTYNNVFPGTRGFFLNGVGSFAAGGIPVGFQPTGQFVGFGSPNTYPKKGKAFNLMIYNRALSESEILQNYYAGLQRFIPTDNLVLWLDGQNTNTRVITPTTAYDASGNNYNGTFSNGATLAYYDAVTSFYFDGINDVITTSLSTLGLSTTWTIWVKRTQSVNTYNAMMGMYLPYFAFRSDNSIQFSNYFLGIQYNLYAYADLADNVWYFMTFVSSYSAGNTTMKIYLNGELQVQQVYVGQQPTTTNNSLRLGGWETGGSNPFNGKIGDVRLYNRELTSTEITNIYLAGTPRYGGVRVYKLMLLSCCDEGIIYVYSTSSSIVVGAYLYTNIALTIPFYSGDYSNFVVNYSNSSCCSNDSGVETTPTGYVGNISGFSGGCPQCGG